jgi:hypothetical protein
MFFNCIGYTAPNDGMIVNDKLERNDKCERKHLQSISRFIPAFLLTDWEKNLKSEQPASGPRFKASTSRHEANLSTNWCNIQILCKQYTTLSRM